MKSPEQQLQNTPVEQAKEDGTQRLFFALWPDDALRRRLAGLAEDIGSRVTGRVVAADNLHITLVFLGALNGVRRQCAEEVAAAIRSERFTLTLDRLGYWSTPRILWAGSMQVPEALQSLAGALQAGLASCGIPLETRPYQPHLTLMRKVNRRPTAAVIDPISWNVERFCLVESVSGSRGVSYRVLASWRLELLSATLFP